MTTWVYIGIWDTPQVCHIYRDAAGQAPEFRNYFQAAQYIRDHQLGRNASPVEISEIELPDRDQG